MKRAVLSLIVLLLSACSVFEESLAPLPLTPEVLITPLASPTQMPASLWAMPTPQHKITCGWSWGSQWRPLINQLLRNEIKSAGVPDADVRVYYRGEDCISRGPEYIVYDDQFAILSSHIEIHVKLDNLNDRALMDQYTLLILKAMDKYGHALSADRGGILYLAFESPSEVLSAGSTFDVADLLTQHPTGEGLLDALGAKIVEQ